MATLVSKVLTEWPYGYLNMQSKVLAQIRVNNAGSGGKFGTFLCHTKSATLHGGHAEISSQLRSISCIEMWSMISSVWNAVWRMKQPAIYFGRAQELERYGLIQK